ncbi:MAG: AmmeMemoRadiSam system radical SAM enzyme [Lachnospiraceae bacterium]|nr:AmmeMemoRadiSam system radical SAM enzyme [Lachnospiraceae bacterium]
MAKCEVCFRHCEIEEGGRGFCKVRTCKDGVIKPVNYGRITSLALDPIEKKPLARFMSGSKILSVGSYGCNLRCPFCQNHEISWSDFAYMLERDSEYVSPEELCKMAVNCKDKGNVGVAFTYNEPLIDYEYIIDCAKLIHENGMVNVLVSNGTADASIARKLEPYIDAMNIDLKGFTAEYYRDVLKGDFECVKAFIEEAVKYAHVELTTLIIPGENDTEEEMREISGYIAGLSDEIPLHISRFFPQFHMTDRPATDVKHIYKLADLAREKLKYVYTGNC